MSAPVATFDETTTTNTTTTADVTQLPSSWVAAESLTAGNLAAGSQLDDNSSDEFSLDESLLESESEQVLDSEKKFPNMEISSEWSERVDSLRHVDSSEASESLLTSEEFKMADEKQDGVTDDSVCFECDEFGNPLL